MSKALRFVDSVSQFGKVLAGLDFERLSATQQLQVIRSEQMVIEYLQGTVVLLQAQMGAKTIFEAAQHPAIRTQPTDAGHRSR